MQDLLKVNLVRAVKAPISDGMVAAKIKESEAERGQQRTLELGTKIIQSTMSKSEDDNTLA